MVWYAVSVVLYFKIKDVLEQDEFHAWENVYLVRAPSPEDARARAAALGRAEAGDSGGTLRFGGRPAELVYGGIRKLTACAPDPQAEGSSDVESIQDGVEATYSSFIVQGRAALEALIAGKPVAVVYDE